MRIIAHGDVDDEVKMMLKKEPCKTISSVDPEWFRRLSELCNYAGVHIDHTTSIIITSRVGQPVKIDVSYIGTKK